MKQKASSLFRDSVYELTASIPKGMVATYGQIAALAGKPGAARAVGALMRNNPSQKTVPCHRVVASNGHLTGFAFGNGLATKKTMLLKEGVTFKGEKVDLATSGWKTPKRSA